MGLGDVSRTWNRLGREDPMWTVLTEPGTARGRWDAAGFETVLGMDISRGMPATAAQLTRNEDRCHFLPNDGPTLADVDSATVDVVYASRVPQHMAPGTATGYVREFFRVARPGRTIVFQIPTRPALTPQGLVIRIIPRLVLDRLRKEMEMRGTAEATARAVVRSRGVGMLEADDEHAGSRWASRLSICRRRGPSRRAGSTAVEAEVNVPSSRGYPVDPDEAAPP